MKKVNIETKTIEVPTKIEVDGKSYPIHTRNIQVINKWKSSGDDSYLDKLVDFSLEFN